MTPKIKNFCIFAKCLGQYYDETLRQQNKTKGKNRNNDMKIRLFTIPNILTLANLMSGAVAVIATLQYHNYTLAMGLVVLAAVFDFLDGFVARLLSQQSPLGLQLDSLADDVTFGLVPALVMFDMYNHSIAYYLSECAAMEYMGYVTLIIAAFSVLRLAKFNIDTTQTVEFSGLPTPANALLLLDMVQTALNFSIHPSLIANNG